MTKIKDFNPTSVFESMRSYDRKIFKLDEHLERLKESAKTAGLELSKKEIANYKNKIEDTYKKSGIKNAYIRIAISSDSKRSSLIIKTVKAYPKENYKKGVSVKTAVVRKQNAMSSYVKSSNFLGGICAKIDAGECFEEVMLNEQGFATEATVSNIFIIRNKCIFTPYASSGLLKGITRQLVLDLAKKLDISTAEVNLTRHDLYNADECFLTNTTINILPVVKIDGRIIGNGRPGDLTKSLMQEFKKLTGGRDG